MNQLTNKEAKENAIREAWGEWYELMRPYMDEHGGITTAYVVGEEWTVLKVRLAASIKKISFNVDEFAYYIPNAIKDIETNNSWIRIESDGSNLPEKEGGYRVVWDNGEIDSIYYSESVKDFWLERFTHYKPIEEEKPPIW